MLFCTSPIINEMTEIQLKIQKNTIFVSAKFNPFYKLTLFNPLYAVICVKLLSNQR